MTVSPIEDFLSTRHIDAETEWLRILNRELTPQDPTINTDLLVRTYQYIVAHPREYRQDKWGVRQLFGPDQFCFAGHAARLAGALPLLKLFRGRLGFQHDVITPAGERVNVLNYAREVLGLTVTQDRLLFRACASPYFIRTLIRQWTGVDPAQV